MAGPSESADQVSAYLDIAALINAARDNGCDAIHPGYGFLSENAELARSCAAAGITFIGPPAQALDLFGDKMAAKSLAQSSGVPIVPGTEEAIADLDQAREFADRVGYPIILVNAYRRSWLGLCKTCNR